MAAGHLDFIPTRGSSIKPTVSKNFQSVVFESHKSTKPKNKDNLNSVETQNDTNEFNIKKAKYEVVKFGMSGFAPKKKEEAKIQLAIKLGAKPPKNKYKNYKLLLEQKAKAKEREKSRISLQQIGKNHLGKSTAKSKRFDKKKKGTKEELLEVYGKVKVAPRSSR